MTVPAVFLFTVTGVRLHCNACGLGASLTGSGCRDDVGPWMAAHYQPWVDEVDVTDEHGHTHTMRRSDP